MALHVLVPMDGSTFAERALATAVALPGDHTVVEALILVERPFFATREYIRSAEEWAERYVPTLHDRYGSPRVEIQPSLQVTHPEEALAEEAASTGADLVVVSSHGRGPMARFIMGSWPDTLVRTARPPVLVVPSDDDDDGEGESVATAPPIGHVLAALDDSDLSRAVLTALPRVLGPKGRITLATVVPTATEMASVYGRGYALPRAQGPVDEDLMGLAERALLEVRGELSEGPYEVDTEVVDGLEPAGAILEAVERLGADAIALATRGREGVSRALLGSVADRVIRHARHPVLVLNPATGDEEG